MVRRSRDGDVDVKIKLPLAVQLGKINRKLLGQLHKQQVSTFREDTSLCNIT